MGVGGEIRLTSSNPVIDTQGRIFDAAPGTTTSRRLADAVAQLKVVQVPASAPVERLGQGLVRLLVEPETAGALQAEVRQGHLENSNVDPAREMVQLVQAMRHAETLQKVGLGYDEMLGNAIRRLGEMS
nr:MULTISPECIES: flagellar basal body rod C-terminal domain-containing protein [Ramlibacter]